MGFINLVSTLISFSDFSPTLVYKSHILYRTINKLYILNKLEQRDKIQGLPSNLSLFRNKINKFNNTGQEKEC